MNDAVNYFNNGYTCSQAIVKTFKNEFNIDEKILEAISYGFGGGMGKSGNICGAVSGGIMVIGMRNMNEKKDIVYKKVNKFISEFKKINGETSCTKLLEFSNELSEEEEKNKFKKKICTNCIKSTVELLNSQLILTK
ncbi:hypothetical protein OSSY52_14770 [Tepiditoga spiralis]|uniref:C_GCAxxG_C_C family protein n=1 Tax=Tepiditoga spiralis TaxID=2108365 RepID=A0A7G1G7J9_9BACT|nr:C-GCAxxG-C-C family protein [Tepiditoga spiralis]BBE31336.1 hypothetical protein OSSY52_14770 [Tepiditoga spiralis]